MLNSCRLILAIFLIIPFSAAQAAKAGLYLSNDSVEAYSLGDANDKLPRHSRQQYSLTVSRESYPRNILLMADTELLDHQKPFRQNGTISPKMLIFLADYFDQRFFALGGGAILRQPPNNERKYELVSELFVAPHLSNQTNTDDRPWKFDFAWSWGIKVQANFSLPDADNAEFNVGFRKIQMDIQNQQRAGFETGFYFGLTSRF